MPSKRKTPRIRMPKLTGAPMSIRGGSAIFPATFGGLDNQVRNYSLNSYGGDQSRATVSSLLMGGKCRRTKRRGTNSKRRGTNRRMRGGNLLGGLTHLNQTLGGNTIMNAGTLMGTTMQK